MRLRSSAEILGLPTGLRDRSRQYVLEPLAMPADDRLWPEDCNRAEDGREPTIEPNEQKAIGIAELWSLRYLPAKHVELLAKD
jgi:hypothetical protein